jgi:hypothetical protein
LRRRIELQVDPALPGTDALLVNNDQQNKHREDDQSAVDQRLAKGE